MVSESITAEIIQIDGSIIAIRSAHGPEALELFFNCQPGPGLYSPQEQAASVYRAIISALEAKGAGFDSIVHENVFLRDPASNLGAIRAARHSVLASASVASHQPATTEIEQAPLNEGAHLEVLVQAIIPNESSLLTDTFKAAAACSCEECARMHALRVHVGGQDRLYAGGLYGRGDDSYEQTHAMFAVAEKLLQQAGMEFSDVMRTWIYFPEMERDYAGFNLARREFFEARGINPIPASTGIGAGLVAEAHALCLGIYAVRGEESPVRTVMTTPTLNEAPVYGSDFSRGMRVDESNRVSLHISGTASLDETGATVHVGDIDAQIDRMLVNVAALLEGQGASFKDVVSAITYLKHPEHEEILRQKFKAAGYDGFPNALVVAEVCRPELLCETEALAVLPVST
ncbi:MAG: Rid family hydrolase [Halieaceae bacterium]